MTAMSELPAEAIEAAHKAWREQAALDGSIFEYNLRAALEAAAPILMAQAFGEGQKSGLRYATRAAAAVRLGRPDLPGPMSPNPYRTT